MHSNCSMSPSSSEVKSDASEFDLPLAPCDPLTPYSYPLSLSLRVPLTLCLCQSICHAPPASYVNCVEQTVSERGRRERERDIDREGGKKRVCCCCCCACNCLRWGQIQFAPLPKTDLPCAWWPKSYR